MNRNTLPRLATTLRRIARALIGDARGNILMTMGLAIIPMTFAIGFGMDYSRAEKLQTQLNAAADAAALAAVDPSMQCQASDTAKTTATNVFTARSNALGGITSITPNITVTPPQGTITCTGLARTATVSFQAQSKNIFGSILGVNSLPISGTAVANASLPPSANFFLALDTSPSMLLPNDTTSQSLLEASTYWPEYSTGVTSTGTNRNGCDFACHANDMAQWRSGMYVVDTSNNVILLDDSTTATATAPQSFFRVSCASGNAVSYYNAATGTNTAIGTAGSIGTQGGSWSTSYSPCNSVKTNYNTPASNATVKLQYTSSTTHTTVTTNVSWPDTLWLAFYYAQVNGGTTSIDLRINDEVSAVTNLLSFAYSKEQTYGGGTCSSSTSGIAPKYGMMFYTFNVSTPAPVAASTATFGSVQDVACTHTSTFPAIDSYANVPLLYQTGYWTSSSTNTGNADTDISDMLTFMGTPASSAMPALSGSGSEASPQDVLVIVTDGMEDYGSASGPWSSADITKCTNIKNNGLGPRIAILYTVYDPTTIVYNGVADSTFTNFKNYINYNTTTNTSAIQTALQSCASVNPDGTYLMQTVAAGGSISGALTTLFTQSLQSARLIQ